MRGFHYIRPTRRGWVIGLGSLFWLLVALVNQTLFAFLLAVLGFAVLLTSLASALFSLHGLRVRRLPAGDASVGQVVSLPLEISNLQWRRRQDLAVIERIGCTQEGTVTCLLPPLGRRQTILFERQVATVRRGEFMLSEVRLRSGDPAGLFCRERAFQRSGVLLVHPQIVSLPELFLHKYESSPTAANHPISTAGASQDFYGVREYNVTDGMRYIHWRSSARYGRLMVKEFERNAIASVILLVDGQEHFVSERQFSNLEYIIQAAASIATHCAGLYCSLTYAAGGSRLQVIEPKAAAEVRYDLMYNLATLRPGPVTLQDVIPAISPFMTRNAVVFCLSLSETSGLRDALESMLAAGMDVRWCCAARDSFSDRKISAKKVAAASSTNGYFRATRLIPESRLDNALKFGEFRTGFSLKE